MKSRLILLLLAGLLHTTPPWAQNPAPPAAAPAGTPATPATPDFRDTSRYAFPAVAQTTFDLQRLAYAMQLREYCANRRVADEFVRERLARFSEMTGREETCNSLADY